jgi:tetratricopeptide (TPR) repeat protein
MASDLAWQQHDFETALVYSGEAVELGRVYELKSEYPWYLNRLGRICIEQGKLTEAREHLSKALDLAYEDASILNPGSPLAQLGEIALFEGNLEEAQLWFEKALTHLAKDDDVFLAIAKTDMAEVSLAQGDFVKARLWLKDAFEPASRQMRRFVVFLSALAGYLVLSSDEKEDKRKAARFYGGIEKLSMQSGVSFNPFYQKLNQERMRLTQEKLSDKEWLDAFESGSGWERGEVLKQIQRELGL